MAIITNYKIPNKFHIFRATLTMPISASTLHLGNTVGTAGLGENLPGAEGGEMAFQRKKFMDVNRFRQKRVLRCREI